MVELEIRLEFSIKKITLLQDPKEIHNSCIHGKNRCLYYRQWS